MKTNGLLLVTLILTSSSTGCMTGPTIFERHDQYSNLEPGSDAWWAEKAMLPPGVRQKCKKGKVWPPVPRSTQEPQQFSHTYHSEHYWPLPYVCQDRAAVAIGFEQQTALGWQEQTTLYEQHFDTATHKLNKAGRLHLEYILHVAPEGRRTVYVQSTYRPELDNMRMESVHQEISMFGQEDQVVPVTLRKCQQYGRPAAEVGQINQRYIYSMHAPRLGGGAGGAAGGGGAGGGGMSGGSGTSF